MDHVLDYLINIWNIGINFRFCIMKHLIKKNKKNLFKINNIVKTKNEIWLQNLEKIYYNIENRFNVEDVIYYICDTIDDFIKALNVQDKFIENNKENIILYLSRIVFRCFSFEDIDINDDIKVILLNFMDWNYATLNQHAEDFESCEEDAGTVFTNFFNFSIKINKEIKHLDEPELLFGMVTAIHNDFVGCEEIEKYIMENNIKIPDDMRYDEDGDINGTVDDVVEYFKEKNYNFVI